MPVKRTLNQYLNKVPVFKVDKGGNSLYFNIPDFPIELSSGKNSFKIFGSSFLKNKTEILIEILDAVGNPIYYEINKIKDRLNERVVTIFIYPDTSIGDVTVIILGQLKDEYVPVNWQEKINVKWSKKIKVDPLKQNSSEILFDTPPNITIIDQFKPAINPILNSGSIISLSNSAFESSSIHYYNLPGLSWTENYYENNSLFSDKESITPKITQKSQQNYNLNDKKNTKFNSAQNSRIWALNDFSINDKSGPTILLDTQVSGSGFSEKMIGGEIIVSSPTNVLPTNSINNSYTGIISDVLNKTTLRLANPFFISSSISPKANIFFVNEFGPNYDYSITYSDISNYSSSQAYKTFATIQFSNLSPISGDIYRIKTFVKSKTSLSDFELVGNNIVNASNLFIDSQSINYNLSIGNVTSKSVIDTYWELSCLNGGSGSLAFDSSKIVNGIKILGTSDSDILKVAPNLTHNYYTDNDYQIRFNCCGVKTTAPPILKVFMSGSAFFDQDSSNGLQIGEITFDTETQLSFQELTFSFSSVSSNSGKPVFIVESGEWHISDIQILPQNYVGFTPNYLTLLVPIDSVWDNNILDFKFEFFDFTEKMSDQIIYVENVPFSKGSPHYIQGNYNLLTGSQYVGKELGTGIEISGKEGSSVSSLGYKGFISASTNIGPEGFLIWSGSVLPNEPDNYSGIGAEFVADSSSYFRYRTSPSEIDVRTDKFFLGSDSQYLSGSNGNIEISSSNFYLDNQGNLTATAATLRNYVFTDYIANNVLILDNSNISNYLITYNHPTISKNFNYLDLSGIGKESAMFIRFEASSSFPISHIVAPTISGFLDNSVGGNIVIEFANSISGNGVYFYDLRKNVGESGIEFSNVYNLSGSNSIHNLSGSFSYLGFRVNHTGSDGTIFSGSLSAKEDARYLFSKGNTGWSLIGTSNFDKTGINLLEVNTPYLTGVRRNDFIRPNELHCSNITGSYLRTFDSNFNLPCLDLSLVSIDGIYQYSSIHGTILIPDYIKTSSFRFILYYKPIPVVFSAGVFTLSGKLSSVSTNQSVSDNFSMAAAPALTPVSLGFSVASSISTLSTGNEIIPWMVDISNASLLSGQLVGFKFDILALKKNSIDISGQVRIYGVRIITDKSTNIGGFTQSDIDNSKRDSETPAL